MASLHHLSVKRTHKGKILSLRITDDHIVPVIRKQDKISLFAEKDFPEPGVPKDYPVWRPQLFLSAIIMLLESAFRP